MVQNTAGLVVYLYVYNYNDRYNSAIEAISPNQVSPSDMQ